MTVKPILVIFSPRDIPEFLESIEKIQTPKLWMKYYPQEQAYRDARQWFLAQEGFTHLIICPDDLIIKQESLDILTVYAEMGYDILSGWCNSTAGKPEDDNIYSNISIEHVTNKLPRQQVWEDLKFDRIKTIINLKPNIVRVAHSGFALTSISRDMVKAVPFRADDNCCVDTCFSQDLKAKGIKQYLHTMVQSRHIRTSPDILQTGKKEKKMWFE